MIDRCDLQVTDYRVLFDDDRYPSSGCAVVTSGDRLLMTVQRASDAERGISSLLTQSDDLGATWTEPRPFGPPLANPETEFQGVAPAHALDDGTVIACGIYLPKGFDRASGGRGLYRPSDILIGHLDPGADEFSWQRIAAGTFLTEQFIAPGISLPDGRLVFTMWGSAVRGDNWQCGVLLSDDGGRTLRYRQVGYEPDPAIRKDPEAMAGFNEQTLFSAPDGTLVSVIRGRDHLGGIPGTNPRSSDCLFFRAESDVGRLTRKVGTVRVVNIARSVPSSRQYREFSRVPTPALPLSPDEHDCLPQCKVNQDFPTDLPLG